MENIENKVCQEFEADRRELDESELDENELNVISGGATCTPEPSDLIAKTLRRWLTTDDGPNIARKLSPRKK